MNTRKEPAVAAGGMAVTAHPLASAAAIAVMSAGGNAVDAAVAAGVAVTVAEPFMSTIFGNSYILIRMADGRNLALDCYGSAPQAAYAGMWSALPRDGEGDEPHPRREGHQAPLVGGALMGMEEAHRRFGRLPWADLLAPAIRIAATGFRASHYYLHAAELNLRKLRRFAASTAQFLPGGEVPALGQRIVRADYAESLRLIAHEGAKALYGGQIGRLMVEEMERGGGLITLADLERYRVAERRPITGSYRGNELTVLPPSCSGGTHVIQMLNILEGFDLRAMGFGSPEAVHVMLEASRIAFADKGRYMGDPAVTRIPLDWLTSKEYAAVRRQGIDLERALEQGPGLAPPWPEESVVPGSMAVDSTDTTHLTIVDADGNIVTTTQTANGLWGSGVTVPGTGLLLNNGMITLDPRPGFTNSLAPGKRGLSTTCPTIISRDGAPWVALGTPGGNRIIASIVQAICNLVDHSMSLQQAVEAPRCFAGTEPEVQLEPDFSPETAAAVAARGHKVTRPTRVAGGMQAVMFNQDGTLTGASCWRSDGAPAGLSIGR